MRKISLLLLVVLFGMTGLALAQAAPSVRGLQPFTPQTRYMSLAGYLRWQYFKQNNAWISMEEAVQLVNSQQ